jgi:3-oxoacyl-[acyl-carrier-protein] synthase-1
MPLLLGAADGTLASRARRGGRGGARRAPAAGALAARPALLDAAPARDEEPMTDRPPCRLAAMGLVCALGSGADEVWPRLLAGEPSRLVVRTDLVPGQALRVGAVEEPLPAVPAPFARWACRNNALALAALRQIEPAVRAAAAEHGPARIGVVMGTSTSGVSDAETAIRHRQRTGALDRSFAYEQLEFGGLAGFVAAVLGAGGPAYTLSTACSSGARALASARSLLRLGLCDAVVAGAVDTLCGLTSNGFAALSALCDGVTNPCSANRCGLTLGEGAAVFLLRRSGAGIQLLGVGESSEAHHMSAPEPTGLGAETAMRGALADAGIAPGAIAYLNLHGTGTPLNDHMECLAVERVFGADLPASSTKPLVGHALGAAGALEAAFCWLVLDRRSGNALALPPHRWDGVRDPQLPPIHLVAKGETAAVEGPARVMTNSFGFGGNNCTLVLGAAA